MIGTRSRISFRCDNVDGMVWPVAPIGPGRISSAEPAGRPPVVSDDAPPGVFAFCPPAEAPGDIGPPTAACPPVAVVGSPLPGATTGLLASPLCAAGCKLWPGTGFGSSGIIFAARASSIVGIFAPPAVVPMASLATSSACATITESGAAKARPATNTVADRKWRFNFTGASKIECGRTTVKRLGSCVKLTESNFVDHPPDGGLTRGAAIRGPLSQIR